ncbi:MAG TPA: UDP-glucuronic acid decarboxylase family protein [Candidatus Dormibacteraeota bacterium]|nr:UDP-glucuronic acid decarboxylase family protein [Candidatus Dormibacteraeota bacterium]
MGRIVVTGGAGFIGSHLADRLVGDGHEVIALDNLSTGHGRNIAHLLGNPRFKFIHLDVTEYIYVDGPVDVIFHLASLPSPVDYLKKPIPTLKVGALGTHKTLGLARAKNALFLLASTSEVYGDPQVHPQPESYWGNVNPVGPRGVYDESKRFAEAMTMAYHRYHGVPTRIFRIFNTYGPRMRPDDGRVVTNFIAQALRERPITVYDDGSRTRSFCFVSDLVEGMMRLWQRGGADPVNLGNPHEMTILEFAKIIKELSKSSSPIEFLVPTDERTKDDPNTRKPDITRARELLGWEPQVALEDGLRATIEYFRDRLREDGA